jgi:hypothetical protein
MTSDDAAQAVKGTAVDNAQEANVEAAVAPGSAPSGASALSRGKEPVFSCSISASSLVPFSLACTCLMKFKM